jgi:hypothetical protein
MHFNADKLSKACSDAILGDEPSPDRRQAH